jgi:hypothetical protein
MSKILGTLVGFMLLIACVVIIFGVMNRNVTEQSVEAPSSLEVVQTSTDWKTVFSENGFTDDEIASYDEILTTVGITDYHDVEVIENGAMHIVRGKIFDSDDLQVNVTLENRKIILVELAGIPATNTEAYINWRGKIKFRTVDTKKAVDLYYDVDGGYVAKLDWENKMIEPIE